MELLHSVALHALQRFGNLDIAVADDLAVTAVERNLAPPYFRDHPEAIVLVLKNPARGRRVSVTAAITDGEKTQDLANVAGLLRPGDHRSFDEGALEAALDLGPYAYEVPLAHIRFSDIRHKARRQLRRLQLEATVTRYSLDQLRHRYVIQGRPLEASLEQILRADTRPGARAILASIEKRRFENRSEGQRLRKMLRFETLLWDQGHDAVAGVDEAGMSPLAGPVCAAAVILKPGTRISGIDDSKKLDANSREALAKEIKDKAASWSVAFVEVWRSTPSTFTGPASLPCGGLLRDW